MATQFPNLGGFSEDQRKAFYSSPDFNASNLNSALQSTGLNAGTVLGDYNQLMGTNVSPTQGASWLTGMSTPQMAQWVNNQSPSSIAGNANYFGMGNQDIADMYNQYYGTGTTGNQWGSFLGNTQAPASQFNVPTNLYPYSQSNSSSGGQSQSYSGMDWSKSPISFEQLQTLAAQLPQLAQEMGGKLYNNYSNMMQQGLGNKGNFAGVLNDIGGRNMMGSTVQSDALAKAAGGMANQIGRKAYEADIQTQLAQMNVPQMLAAIAELGKVGTSQSTSSGSSSGMTANPLAPYELIAQMIAGSY